MDERDPGADTAMFRRYVQDGSSAPQQAPASNRTPIIIAAVVAVLVLVLIAAFAL